MGVKTLERYSINFGKESIMDKNRDLMKDPVYPVPYLRPRRLRKSAGIRKLIRETHLNVSDFIYPLFVTHEKGIKREISSMPGCFHYGVDRVGEIASEVFKAGIPAVLLFGLPCF